MIAQGLIDIYEVDKDFDFSIDLGALTFCVNIGELPTKYFVGERMVLAFDFAPLKSWTLYKADANQLVNFNAQEWSVDTTSPYAFAIAASQEDGELATALADGKIIITVSATAPANPDYYDIWQCPAINVAIGSLSAADAEAFASNATDDVYFYYGIDNTWHLVTAAMKSAIKESQGIKTVKSQASVWNTVNVAGDKYINGWQSIIEYQGNVVTKNDFAIIADNFYIGAVGNIVQNGVDANGQPIYESTGEAYKPFSVDTVNHEIVIDGVMKSNDFTAIGGSGFRLKSKAAGSAADPTIYGAYIKGAQIDGGMIKAASLDVGDITVLTQSGNGTELFNIGSSDGSLVYVSSPLDYYYSCSINIEASESTYIGTYKNAQIGSLRKLSIISGAKPIGIYGKDMVYYRIFRTALSNVDRVGITVRAGSTVYASLYSYDYDTHEFIETWYYDELHVSPFYFILNHDGTAHNVYIGSRVDTIAYYPSDATALSIDIRYYNASGTKLNPDGGNGQGFPFQYFHSNL
jgi:hypothetical protein